MSVSKDQVPLIAAAAELARTSPQAWSKFLTEVARYTDVGKDQLVACPMQSLEWFQGKTVERVQMYQLLSTCLLEANKLQK